MFENYLLISHLRKDSDIPIGTYLMTYFDSFFSRQDKNIALISEFKLKKKNLYSFMLF